MPDLCTVCKEPMDAPRHSVEIQDGHGSRKEQRACAAKEGQTEFSIAPLDASEIARFTAEAKAAVAEAKAAKAEADFRILQATRDNEKAVAALNAVYARVREKAGIPEGADFKWDDSGLKGQYEPPKADG